MSKQLIKAILQTLVYADLFYYPLNEKQLWKFLINDTKVSKKDVKMVLTELDKKGKIVLKDGFYCLLERLHLIEKRKKKEIYSKKKNYIAQRVSSYLSYIPTVYLIGVSGGLAVANADEKDDIDFFVIAKKNTLWLTRLLVLIVLEIFGLRRKREEMHVSDKICLNMLLDEGDLLLSEKQQNLYTAHEVLQMMPLFERNNTYRKFLQANVWVGKFLPNATTGIKNKELRIKEKNKNSLFILEFLAKKAQLWYMIKNHPNKMITDTFIAFYPVDYQRRILNRYKSRLKRFKIL